MRQRRKLSYAGIVTLSIVLRKKDGVVLDCFASGAGVIIGEDEDDGTDELADNLDEAISKLGSAKRKDDEAVEQTARRAARNHFDEHWGKRPVMHTIIHRV